MNTATISLEYLDELRNFVEKSKNKNNAQIVIGFEGWKREWYTKKGCVTVVILLLLFWSLIIWIIT